MLVDSNAVRGNWTIGKIIEVDPGKDGKVRNVTVKTQNGNYRIPITIRSQLYTPWTENRMRTMSSLGWRMFR